MSLNSVTITCIVFLSHVVIGDEILKGLVQDTNSTFLCKQLWELGIKVERVGAIVCMRSCVRALVSLEDLSLQILV